VRELKQITVLMFIFLISSSLAVVVGSDLASAADVENESISAGFSASPTEGEARKQVRLLTAHRESDKLEWDFGDGGTQYQSPSHIYSKAELTP
jgi:PKD repeat protein